MPMPMPHLSAPRSLHARLAAWQALVLGVVLVAFALAVYGLVAGSLRGEIDRSLVDRAGQVNNSIRLNPPFSARQFVVIPRPDSFASADTFVQVLSLEGHVLGASENLGDFRLPFTAADVAAVRSVSGRFSDAELNGEPLRLYTAPLVLQGEAIGVIQVARSPARIEGALGQLRWLAGLALLFALCLSVFAIWVTARAALHPLQRIIQAAEGIGLSGDLGRRVPQQASGDEVARLAATFNRMLERLEASARALQQAYAKEAGALEAQRRFVADASHELRTPLTTIRSNAGLLRQFPDVTGEDRNAALKQIDEEADRMSRLVQDLLTLARADAGQKLVKVPVSLAPLIEDVVAQAKLLSRDRPAITASVQEVGQVAGDPDALRRLALLLVDNAIKYTPPEGRVDVRLERCGGEVALTVADTGPGIGPEDLPNIFERFYRGDPSRKAGGSGLGLAIAKGIAEAHGGSIQVASAPGAGATFTVHLPPEDGRDEGDDGSPTGDFLPGSNLLLPED